MLVATEHQSCGMSSFEAMLSQQLQPTCSCRQRVFLILLLRVRAWWISMEAPPG